MGQSDPLRVGPQPDVSAAPAVAPRPAPQAAPAPSIDPNPEWAECVAWVGREPAAERTQDPAPEIWEPGAGAPGKPVASVRPRFGQDDEADLLPPRPLLARLAAGRGRRTMIVEMPTVKQAAQVAAATGWEHLPGKAEGKMSARLRAVGGFEAGRAIVEAVTVLFKLYEPGPDGKLTPVPTGWSVRGMQFEVEWPKDKALVRSHFGARRFAYNWALNQVKTDMDARKDNPAHKSIPWNFQELRNAWNQAKDQVAPWWAGNSKEAYASGIADLVRGLDNWRKSRDGSRKGARVGFPKFKSKSRDAGRVRFTTGTMRLEADRRGITVPVIGTLRSKENTRRLQRPLAQGRARILNMTVTERWGRLYVSACYVTRTTAQRPPAKPGVRAGVDLGLRSMATVVATDGTVREMPRLAPLKAALAERRQAGREISRRIPGSRGYRQAKAKLARLDRRAVCIRRETWHQFTRELAARYGEVVIEDLNIAAMKQGMGRRAFRRSVSDTALGMFRPCFSIRQQPRARRSPSPAAGSPHPSSTTAADAA